MADDLTIAYLAIGAHRALTEIPMSNDVCDRYEGQIGFVQTVIDWAPMLDQLAADNQGNIDGCFDYDVTEPFGYHAAVCMLKQRGPLSVYDAQEYAKTLIADITPKEVASPLEQAFREFEEVLVTHEAAGAFVQEAREKYDASTKAFIAARKQLWTLMPKQQTYVRGDRAFFAPSSSNAEINISMVAKA